MTDTDIWKTEISGAQKKALAVGILASAVSVFGYLKSPAEFYPSYLMAFLYWLGLGCGSIAWLHIHHLAGGRWAFVVQRPMEAAARTIPLLALFFVPVIFGMHTLFEWTHKDVVAHDPILQAKQFYLNEKGFLIRAAVYFVVWAFAAYRFSALSKRLDEGGDVERTQGSLLRLAGFGLVVFVLATTCASFDWGMSLEPHWFSTMYGPLFMVGQGLTTLCVMAVLLSKLARHNPMLHYVHHQQFHDVGNLIFALTIFWTYLGIGQFLIIWAANIPEEITYYLERLSGGWKWVAVGLAVFHFAIPFLILLNKPVKRHGRILAKVALFLLVMRWLDYYWMVQPTFREEVRFHWLDLTIWLGLGGLWVAAFLGQLKRRPLLPLGDPRFKKMMAEHTAVGH